MLPENESDIEALLGDGSRFQAAERYYDAGYVRAIGVSAESEILGRVQADGDSVHSLQISTENGGLHASCDCDRSAPCEHAGAVLITLLREEIPVKPGTRWGGHIAGLGESRKKAATEQRRPEPAGKNRELIQLNRYNVTDLAALQVLETLAALNTAGTRETSDRVHKLVFLLERDEEEQWWLRAALHYLRRDGTRGSFTAITSDRVTEEVSPEERALLGAIVGSSSADASEFRAPAAAVVEQIAACPNVELYINRDAASHPTRADIASFDSARVSFVAEAFVPAPRFTPRVSLYNGDEELLRLDYDSELLCAGSALLFLSTLQNSVAVCPAGRASGLSELLAMLLSTTARFAYGDIVRLHAAAAQVAPDHAVIALPPAQVEFRTLTPTPLLYLSRRGERTYARPAFGYQEEGAEGGENRSSGIGSAFASLYESDTLVVSRRNRTAEKRLLRRFRSAVSALTTGPAERGEEKEDGRDNPNFPEPLLLPAPMDTVLHELAVPLLQEGWQVAVQNRRVRRLSESLRFTVVASRTDWFDLRPYVEEADGSVTWLDIDDERVREGLIATGAGYSLLTRADIELLSDLHHYPRGREGTVRVKSFDLGAVAALSDRTDADDSFGRARAMVSALQSLRPDEAPELPVWFAGTLRAYQHTATSWLDQLYRYGLSGCLADDMGLGKTIQALAFLALRKEAGELERCLAVVPVSTIGNWKAEAERFTPKLSVHVHAGSDRMRYLEGQRAADLTIVSYETLLQDVESFAEHSFSFLVVDESQRIKNAGTQTYRAVKKMQAGMRIALTGTPVENTTLELWSLMNLLLPGLLGSRSSFRSNYGVPIEKQGDEAAARRLKRVVSPFILRRRKEDVAEQLPPREEIELNVEMPERQRALYEQLREQYREEIRATMRRKDGSSAGGRGGRTGDGAGDSGTGTGGNGASGAQKVLEGLLRLRQVALFPDLLDEAYVGLPSCKQDVLLEHIEPLVQEGHKALVFSQFVSVLSRLDAALAQAGISTAYLDGSTRNRQAVIERFQNDPEVSVFLISLRAGGVGINLTAADYVYLFDPWWNPAVESQAIDRTHRIGQSRHVIAYRLIAKDSVEEKIVNLQKKKKELSQSITPSDHDIVQSLSQEELIKLFEP